MHLHNNRLPEDGGRVEQHQLGRFCSMYGPISEWDVSSITDMNGLFRNLATFNENVSTWNTSSVTDMSHMFSVRFPCQLTSWPLPPSLNALLPEIINCLPFSRAPFSMSQGAAAFNNHSLSFDTSSVTDMSYMFEVRSTPAQHQLRSWGPSCACLRRRRPAPSFCPSPHVAPVPMLFPFDSAHRARWRSTSR